LFSLIRNPPRSFATSAVGRTIHRLTAGGAEGRRGFQLVDHPLEAVFEVKHVEVDQKLIRNPALLSLIRKPPRSSATSAVGRTIHRLTAEGAEGSSLFITRRRPAPNPNLSPNPLHNPNLDLALTSSGRVRGSERRIKIRMKIRKRIKRKSKIRMRTSSAILRDPPRPPRLVGPVTGSPRRARRGADGFSFVDHQTASCS
jgi:hypothetical protein